MNRIGEKDERYTGLDKNKSSNFGCVFSFLLHFYRHLLHFLAVEIEMSNTG